MHAPPDARRRAPRWLATCLLAACAAACGDAARDRSLAAETRDQQGPGYVAPGGMPFGFDRVPRIGSCTPAEALAGLAAAGPERRAAAALCAVRLPCDRGAIDAGLIAAQGDTAVAASYVDRGTVLGSGDQTTALPVSAFATWALGERMRSCPPPPLPER